MTGDALLTAAGLHRSYPGVAALRDVSLEVAPQQVHALLGENGAGKSTLIRILSGVESPDRGALTLGGVPYAPATPLAALRAGVSTLYQEQMLLSQRSVTDNVLLGSGATRAGVFRDHRRNRALTREALDRVGAAHLDPRMIVGDLSVADRQMVDIARALVGRSRLLILDEPTAALSAGEVDALFAVVSDLPKQGVSVLMVSHRLDEIYRVCQAVTVLRDGKHVLSDALANVNPDQLVAAMVGDEVTTSLPERGERQRGRVLLAARGLGGAGFDGIDLDVHEGEVLGVTGITGSGKEQLAEVLYGARRPTRGTVEVLGRPVRLTPRRAASAGVAGVPGDRAREGVIAALPVSANLVLPSLPQVSRAGFLRRAAVRDLVARRITQLAIKVRGGGVPVVQLSGGNQQKVALGKWLERAPRVLVLVEPTQGIDVKVRYEFYRLIRGLAAEGRAVVLVSSDLPEVLTVADRIVVLKSGSVVGELAAAEATSEAVVRLSFGRSPSPTPARNP